MPDIDRVAVALAERFPTPPVASGFGWEAPALNVIDCVLSLNRRYLGFVMPRLGIFRGKRPAVTTLGDLRELIGSYETPAAFLESELDYRDPTRATTLLGVTEYLIDEIRDHVGTNEGERLASWALSSRPGDYLIVGVPGFGLAGFQYLRMLFGAQTTKPDKHIRAFVAGAVGHQVTDVQALLLMERAARRLQLPLRDVDHEIWKQRSAGSSRGV